MSTPQIKVRNPTSQTQELPVPGKPKVGAGAVYPHWVARTDSVELALARGRFDVIDTLIAEATSPKMSLPGRKDEPTDKPKPPQTKKKGRGAAKKDG